jgi:cytochrome c
MRSGGVLLGAAATACLVSCGCTPLPDADSPGARLYAERCGSCHRAYQPGVMTFEMWKVAIGRMQGVLSRNGLRPLDAGEMKVLLRYLEQHSG